MFYYIFKKLKYSLTRPYFKVESDDPYTYNHIFSK